MRDELLRTQLLALRERDQAKRRELVERRELWHGYHTEMEAVHVENAERLERVLDARGWPGASEVGEEASDAAWLVALHAISRPAFQRRCLALMQRALDAGEANAARLATLVDRIRFNERRPQVYGTLFDWDAQGVLAPWPIEDADAVDERRRAVGLPALAESVREVQEDAARELAQPPAPYAERQAELHAWARRVGRIAE